MRRIALVPLLLALLLASPSQLPFSAGAAQARTADATPVPTPAKIFGVMEDRPVMGLASEAGFNIVKRTVWIAPANNAWANPQHVPGVVPIPQRYRREIDSDMADAAKYGERVILELYPVITFGQPQGPSQMRGTCDVAHDMAERFHDVLYGIEVGVEPNNHTFFRHQWDPDGSQASAKIYERWLAFCYDRIKSVDPSLMVIGGSLASSGEDNPHKPTSGTSPTLFIQKLCETYQESGRDLPIMDILDVHSYQSRDPSVSHPDSTMITIGDHDKLLRLLGCFKGTAQPIPWILWGESGYETKIPQGQLYRYTTLPGRPKTEANSGRLDETDQGDYYAQEIRMAYCQSHVVGWIGFHMIDETELSGWQSGLYYAPVRGRRGTDAATLAVRAKHSLSLVRSAAKDALSGAMTCPATNPGTP